MGIRNGRGDSDPPIYPVQAQGPRAKDVVGSLFGDEVLETPYYHCAHAALDGIPVALGRTGWTGEVGYEIYLLDPERGDDLWDRVMEAGAPHDIWPIAPWEPRRIEAGLQLPLGHDARRQSLLGDRARAAGRGAGDRLHRQGGARADMRRGRDPQAGRHGGRRRRARLGATQFWPARQNGDRVGYATVAIHSPGLKKNIGYGGADRARRAGQGPRARAPRRLAAGGADGGAAVHHRGRSGRRRSRDHPGIWMDHRAAFANPARMKRDEGGIDVRKAQPRSTTCRRGVQRRRHECVPRSPRARVDPGRPAGQAARDRHGGDQGGGGAVPLHEPELESEVVGVLESDGLAMTHALWRLEGTDRDGKPVTLAGLGTVVSRRQPDGSWRIVLHNPLSP